MRLLLTSILLVSASAIAYEILLLRLLSIIHWHHFAWMIISLALMGYGVSGTVIAMVNSFAGRWLENRFEAVFSACAMMLSVSMVGCFLLAQRLPFNALEVIWNPRQFFYLGVMYLLFMVPFFFAASCIGAAFTCRSAHAGRIYFFDLLGAGLGAVLVIAVLFLLLPQQVLLVLAALALSAAWLASRMSAYRRPLAVLQFAWLLVLLFLLPADRIELRMSEFKGLSQALEVVDSRVLAQSSSPLGLLTVVDSPRIPFRHAPGLSFGTRFMPPEQLAVFTDGDSMSVINRYEGNGESVSYLADVTAALPYSLLDRPVVLILGAGAGSDVLMALLHDAAQVDAVELNPQVVALVKDRFAEFSGGLYDHDRVSIHIGEARGFVARSPERYDLIQVGLLDSFAVSGSGVQALNESYLYTVEALRKYIEHLTPGGLLAITRWLKVPPRDSLKLAATVIEALRQMGVDDPGNYIAVIRNWNTVTLLVKNEAFEEADIETIREFSRSRSFDTVWYPEMAQVQANRFNQLERAWMYEGIRALLGGEAEEFLDQYKFKVAAATDDRPYFFHFFKWRVLPEIIALREQGGAGLLEWGYLVLTATMIQAAMAGVILILLPLWVIGRVKPAGASPMGSYFFLLGLAFLFIEMAFIQKFILFLSHPLYSVAVVLAGFLVFAGLGSAASSRISQRFGRRQRLVVAMAVVGIVSIALSYAFLLPLLFDRMIGLADGFKVAISLALIAPLAFCMGMPFPLGMKRLAKQAPDFIPWAWGINGFASVISAALATLLAIELGFTFVLLFALALYVAAGLLFARQ